MKQGDIIGEHPGLGVRSLPPIRKPFKALRIFAGAEEDVADLAPGPIVFVKPVAMAADDAGQSAAFQSCAAEEATTRAIMVDGFSQDSEISDDRVLAGLADLHKFVEFTMITPLAPDAATFNEHPAGIRMGFRLAHEAKQDLFNFAEPAGANGFVEDEVERTVICFGIEAEIAENREGARA